MSTRFVPHFPNRPVCVSPAGPARHPLLRFGSGVSEADVAVGAKERAEKLKQDELTRSIRAKDEAEAAQKAQHTEPPKAQGTGTYAFTDWAAAFKPHGIGGAGGSALGGGSTIPSASFSSLVNHSAGGDVSAILNKGQEALDTFKASKSGGSGDETKRMMDMISQMTEALKAPSRMSPEDRKRMTDLEQKMERALAQIKNGTS